MKEKSPKSDGKKKKSTYKTKRSFTRNKKLRRDEPGKFRDGFKRSFSKTDGQERWKTKDSTGSGFDKDKRESSKDKRAERKQKFVRREERKGEGREFARKEGFGKGPKKAFRKPGADRADRRDAGKGFDAGDERKKGQRFEADKRREGFAGKKREGRDGGKNGFSERRGGGYQNDFGKKTPGKPTFAEKGLIRLNRYIANAGVCSRREADDLIATGCVTVNGKVITELGYKVKEGDVVTYGGEKLKTEKHVYLLLNKPKDYITTAEDDRGRRTVMDLIAGAVKERVYPVGRLDRNTTGLLLFTNDGEMAKKLTHPQHRVQKLYHVELDKNLKQDDLQQIQEGIELEDGFIKPDEVAYAGESKREVGIMIHSGRNRVVRRIFESLGYDVLRLDRVMFAGLTKKDLPRGHWRLLTDKEIAFLKMI